MMMDECQVKLWWCAWCRSQGKYVDVHVSAAKCIRLALSGAYPSGEHIDIGDSY